MANWRRKSWRIELQLDSARKEAAELKEDGSSVAGNIEAKKSNRTKSRMEKLEKVEPEKRKLAKPDWNTAK